ncbi:MAG: SET domain-containing protein-lysine N-methyltransferase [Candidatus Nanoarchaeia archaeon]|nr:SET domain-containing protein-lysine N-methyltransferase [Candidatus Nanoarchaeia archaeon]
MKKTRPKVDLSFIKIKNSKIHGKGVYAKQDIKKKTKVIEYVGEIISKKEGDRRADLQFDEAKKNKEKGAVYVFELDKENDLDGDVSYNPAKYINHSCNPNCKVSIRNKRIWIKAIKNIKKGEEINYDYGYELDNDYKDHPCKCGSKNCIGYIIGKDYWKKFKKMQRKEEVLKV